MKFSRKKLPLEAATDLLRCPIETVRPFALMFSPVYVYLKMNAKFVSVRGPLDFFSPEDLQRYLPYSNFFVPNSAEDALKFRQAALHVRCILEVAENALPISKSGDGLAQTALPPSEFEVSDAVLKFMGPLWGEGLKLEPFFAAVFANELCETIPGAILKQSHDGDVLLHDRALMISGWCVFLALHLGICERTFLNSLRLRLFEQLTALKPAEPFSFEMQEIVNLSIESFDAGEGRIIEGSFFERHSSKAARKLSARLERVRENLIPQGQLPATIYGERGFIDVESA